MEKVLNPIIVNEKKELGVPDFNKKEVESVAKGVCINKVDIDNPFEGVVEIISSGTLDEALAQGKLLITTLGEEEIEITEEQYDKIYVLLKKACADGKVRWDNYVCLLNYLYKSTTILTFCFGCGSSGTHQGQAGVHIAIVLNGNSYMCNVYEL